MPEILKWTVETLTLCHWHFFSSGKNWIGHIWKFFFQGPETKLLVKESNMNNMFVSVLIQLLRDSFTEGYITCEGKAYVRILEKSVILILFSEQLVFLHSLIFVLIWGVMGQINAKIRRRKRTDLRGWIAAVVKKSTRR